jgi:hypothetical protein
MSVAWPIPAWTFTDVGAVGTVTGATGATAADIAALIETVLT